MVRKASTKTDILRTIKRLQRSGKPLNYSAVRRWDPRFLARACRMFGSWNAALEAVGIEAAGIDYQQLLDEHPRRWTKTLKVDVVRDQNRKWPRARVLQEIRVRHVEGKLLNTDRMLREDLALHTAGRRHFGTWRKAVEAAGIDYNQYVRGGLYGWTRAKTLRALGQRLADHHGACKQVQEDSPSLYRAAMHYCHTWEAAVRKARQRS